MPMNTKVASSLFLNEASFSADEADGGSVKTTGGLIEFQLGGKFIHFNTIEEYQAFDYSTLSGDKSQQERHQLPDFEKSVANGENYFIMACFGDLKNYDFHYKLAFVQGTEKLETVKGKKLAKAVSKEQIAKFREKVVENVQSQKDKKYLEQSFEIKAEDGQGDFLCFYDNSPLHPSLLLNNLLQKRLADFRGNAEGPNE